MSADAQLAAYVDRVLRMKEEADGIAEDIKAIYGEAKNEGYDKTQLGNLVTYLRKRAKDKDGEAEKEAVFDLYLSAYLRAKGEVGTARATRTHAPDDEITEPQVAPQPAHAGAIGISSPSVENEGAAISTPIQPETANDIHERASTNDKASSEAGPQAEASLAGTGSEMLADREARIEGQGAPVTLPTLSFADRIKKLRPLCQRPNSCRSSGGKAHCYVCMKASNEAGAA